MEFVKQRIKAEASGFATLDKVKPGMLLWRHVGCAPYSIGIVKKVLSDSIVLKDGVVLKNVKDNVYHFRDVPFKLEVDAAVFYDRLEKWEFEEVQNAISTLKSKCKKYSIDSCDNCSIRHYCKGMFKKLKEIK